MTTHRPASQLHTPPSHRTSHTDYAQDGWNFRAMKGCISGRDDLVNIENRLSPPCLPEMCFGDNKLEIEHKASGTKVALFLLFEFHISGTATFSCRWRPLYGADSV